MWFGTETGLARFDGRRTQTINDPAIPLGRILALYTDKDGGLWVGSEAGAARLNGNAFLKINETAGQSISAITANRSGSVVMTSEQGRVYESRARTVTSTENETTVTRLVVDTRELLNQPLESADRDRPGPLVITSVAVAGNRLFVGTHSRGVLEIANGVAKESQTRPATYFVNALELDKDGKLWAGVRAKKELVQ
jgi:ligand-binding sensor domain-containing protein